MNRAQAGYLGGMATLERYGPEHYRLITKGTTADTTQFDTRSWLGGRGVCARSQSHEKGETGDRQRLTKGKRHDLSPGVTTMPPVTILIEVSTGDAGDKPA